MDSPNQTEKTRNSYKVAIAVIIATLQIGTYAILVKFVFSCYQLSFSTDFQANIFVGVIAYIIYRYINYCFSPNKPDNLRMFYILLGIFMLTIAFIRFFSDFQFIRKHEPQGWSYEFVKQAHTVKPSPVPTPELTLQEITNIKQAAEHRNRVGNVFLGLMFFIGAGLIGFILWNERSRKGKTRKKSKNDP